MGTLPAHAPLGGIASLAAEIVINGVVIHNHL